MNKLFLKELKSSLKTLMKENHFLVNGQAYIRVINNQILQTIDFQGFSGGDRFTVNIGIIPICADEFKSVPTHGGIRIGTLFFNGDKWWEYSNDSINEITDTIENKLLPLLDKLSSYENIYNELKKEISNIPRKERDWNDINTVIHYSSIGDECLFWLCLRNNDYNGCKILLDNLKNENLNWLNSCLKSCEENIKNTQIIKYKKMFEEYKNNYIELARKASNKYENLEKLLDNNEIEKMKTITNEYEAKNLITLEKYII